MKSRAVSPSPDAWGSIQIAGGYFLLGILWILFSDTIAEKIAANTEILSQISLYKGWGYVFVTAVLLYWLLRLYARSIKDTNQRYKLIAENASDVIWLLDPLKGRFKYMSPSVLKLRGYTAEEVMSQSLSEAFLPEDFERLTALTMERISQFQAKGSGTISYVDEIVQPHRDGSIVYTEVITTYLFNEQNEIEIIGVTRNINRRKEAEQKQRASEKNYQELLDQASDGIFIANPSGRYTLVNEQACRLVGYTKEELLSMNIRDLVAPEDLAATPLRLDELKTGKILITERKFVHKNESRINCEISSKILPDGSLQSIVRDITERKVTEDALIRSEKRYRSLFENMTNGYARCQMLYDEEGKPCDFIYLDVNRAFRELTGLKDVIGRRVSEVIPGIHESNHELLEFYGRVASTGKADKFETYIPTLGSGIWFSVSAYSPEKDFFVAVFETITERKKAEESLQLSYLQLLSFIDQAPLSIVMLDRNMNYLAASRRWITEYGRGHADLIGLNHYEVQSDMPDHWKESHQKGLAGETVKNNDDLWVQANGTKSWLKWAVTPWRDIDGKVGGIIISSEDLSERKRAEAAAFKSELRYHRILDAMMEGCQIIDFDWKYVYVNDVVAKQGRYRPLELLNHTVMEMYPGMEQTEMFAALRRCMEDREPKRMENQFIFPDGNIGWFELSIQPAEEGIFILSTDITERKLAEDALRQSQENFARAFNSNPAALAITRIDDGTFLIVNESYTDVMGYQPEEILGHGVAELEIYVNPPERNELIRQLRELGRVRNHELLVRSKPGKVRSLMVSMEPILYDASPCILSTFIDITDRKQMEEEIRKLNAELEQRVIERTAELSEANALLQAMMDNIPDQIYFKDRKSRFIRNSRAQAELMGLNDPEEAVGKSDFDFFPHAQRSFDEEQEVMRSGQPLLDIEEYVVWPSGRIMWVSTSKAPLIDQAGRTIGIFGISRDITERKHAEENLQKAKTELETANKELESFSYSVSHDLRAPLRAIDGYTNILLEDYESILDEEGKRVCGIISRETKRMGRLIDDLLSFSRMGRREIHLQKIDMKALVDSVLDELLRQNDRSRIEIQVADLPPATGDNALMRQVWVNLLSNAIKFTSKKERAVIQVDSAENEEGVIYAVRDNGAGFEMEYADKLFGVFQRLHGESEFEGTGVGLAIVQRVVHRHGGRIWAEGKVEEGATFHFLLPRRNE